MPQSQPASFIPHEMPKSPTGKIPGRGLTDLLVLIAIVLFVASVSLAAGVFLYQQYLQSSLRSKTDQLNRAKAAFEPALVQELTRLDDRMRAGGEVLGSHLAPSTFFKMLEASTIQTVAFNSLVLQATDPQHMTVGMEGVADSVNSIALQADLFSKGGVITSPIFSNIDRQADGVHFNVTAILNPAAINYEQLTSAPAPQAPAAAQPTQNSPFGGAQSGNPPPQGQAPSGATNVQIPNLKPAGATDQTD